MVVEANHKRHLLCSRLRLFSENGIIEDKELPRCGVGMTNLTEDLGRRPGLRVELLNA